MIYFLHKNEKVQEKKNTHKFLSSTYFSSISVLPKKKLATNKQTNGSLYAAIAKNTAKTNIDKHMVG